MLHKTNGIVLRSVKYGDTSLVVTIFTRLHGLQAYMVQGARSAKAGKNRAAYFQHGLLLDLVAQQQPLKKMQRLREYSAAHIYSALHEDVVKNSIAILSLELLLRLLPEQAPMHGLFDFAWQYFITLDKTEAGNAANFPVYFIIQCCREFGYDLKGSYSSHTPYLNIHEGGFTEQAPASPPYIDQADAAMLSQMLPVNDYEALAHIHMNADMRMRLSDWFIAYLRIHTQHMGQIKSLSVLRAILH